MQTTHMNFPTTDLQKKFENCSFMAKRRVIHFSYMVKINQFFLSPVCSIVLKKPQKWLNFFLLFFENVQKLYNTPFLHTLDVWNCVIMIFVGCN